MHPALTHPITFTTALIKFTRQVAKDARQDCPQLTRKQTLTVIHAVLRHGEWYVNQHGQIEYPRYKYYYCDVTNAVQDALDQ